MRQQLNRALNVQEIQRLAPSVFAEAPSDKMSEKYMFIPTIDVVKQIESQGFSVVSALQSRSKTPEGKDFAKHMLRFRKTEHLEKQLLNVGDSVTELVLTNSHDGASAFNLALGLFRQVCANGLCVSDNIAAASVRHIGYSHDKIINAQFDVLSKETLLIESVQSMRDVTLSQEERLALASSALDLRYDSGATKPRPDQLLQPRRYADTSKDLWTTFNVIQENMIRGGLRTITQNERGQVRRNSTRAVNSVSENKRLNQALWTLAETMKQLKGAA